MKLSRITVHARHKWQKLRWFSNISQAKRIQKNTLLSSIAFWQTLIYLNINLTRSCMCDHFMNYLVISKHKLAKNTNKLINEINTDALKNALIHRLANFQLYLWWTLANNFRQIKINIAERNINSAHEQLLSLTTPMQQLLSLLKIFSNGYL